MFDPKPHLIHLPRRVKDRQTGQVTTVYDDYLEVKWRLVWFRERFPHGVIETHEICVDLEGGYARYRGVSVNLLYGFGPIMALGRMALLIRSQSSKVSRLERNW
jgi:hypothetical protein